MKTHTTNYFNTFIETAEDTKVKSGTKPPAGKNSKTVAEMQFDIIAENPYKYTSDEVLFDIYAERNDIPETELDSAGEHFFSKGQPCFRASPLTKSYGFGVHFNEEGKMALYGMESTDYKNFCSDPAVKKVKAMRSSKKPASRRNGFPET